MQDSRINRTVERVKEMVSDGLRRTVEHKFRVQLVDPSADPETVCRELEGIPAFARYESKISLILAEVPEYYELVVSVPPEGPSTGGPFGSFVKQLVRNETSDWLIHELGY